jgi:microcystin-dependent protein
MRRYARRISIPDDIQFIANVSGALLELANPYNWTQFGAVSPEDAAAAAWAMIQEYWEDTMIGQIVPYVTVDPPPGTLPCDGSLYDAADYPELWIQLDPAFYAGPDTFRTPDLRGRVLIGAGTLDTHTYTVNVVGGEAEHTLTTAEMPAHTHGESISVPTIINGGLEAPASAATPGTGTTGSAGGGDAHNNLQPYLPIKYAVYY